MSIVESPLEAAGNDRRTLTLEEAAAYLGVTEGVVRGFVYGRKLRSERSGPVQHFAQVDLDAVAAGDVFGPAQRSYIVVAAPDAEGRCAVGLMSSAEALPVAGERQRTITDGDELVALQAEWGVDLVTGAGACHLIPPGGA